MIDKEVRLKALQQHLSATDEEMENARCGGYDDSFGIEIGNEEYLVLTDMEADDIARKYILDSLWAFNADFIIKHCSTYEDMSNLEYEHIKDAMKEMQGKLCEGANPLIKALIENIDDFVNDAIISDGRGPFVAQYDGRENEEEVNGVTYYIYQIN